MMTLADALTTPSLTDRLGYVFTQPELLRAALTHPSVAGRSGAQKKNPSAYERLEFLGDRVLGLVIAQWLYDVFPQAAEGELAKRHAAMVNRDALREVALALNLDSHIQLAHGDAMDFSKKNMAVLSDAMEAVIGAMYLDGGLDVAVTFIKHYWWEMIGAEATPADPKSELQELAQGKGLPLPVYKILKRSGPAHAPSFVIEASVKGLGSASAEGPSKREAEKGAACALLKEITGS
jgi:ribonuclease III